MNIKKLKDLKNIKNIELYLAVILGVVILAVACGSVLSDKKSQQHSATSTEYLSQSEYVAYMENKISNVIAQMGCGKVSVAISCQTLGETVYAYQTVTSTDGSGTKQTTSIVTVQGNPLVVSTKPPQISGVVVVADGADDPTVRVKIKQVVVTLLSVCADNVQVFTYKN